MHIISLAFPRGVYHIGCHVSCEGLRWTFIIRAKWPFSILDTETWETHLLWYTGWFSLTFIEFILRYGKSLVHWDRTVFLRTNRWTGCCTKAEHTRDNRLNICLQSFPAHVQVVVINGSAFQHVYMMCWELWRYYQGDKNYKLVIENGRALAQDHSSLHFKQGSNLVYWNLLKHPAS